MPALPLSIIIPSCNRPRKLAACLRALKGQEAEEVVICDDGFGDALVAAAECPAPA